MLKYSKICLFILLFHFLKLRLKRRTNSSIKVISVLLFVLHHYACMKHCQQRVKVISTRCETEQYQIISTSNFCLTFCFDSTKTQYIFYLNIVQQGRAYVELKNIYRNFRLSVFIIGMHWRRGPSLPKHSYFKNLGSNFVEKSLFS